MTMLLIVDGVSEAQSSDVFPVWGLVSLHPAAGSNLKAENSPPQGEKRWGLHDKQVGSGNSYLAPHH